MEVSSEKCNKRVHQMCMFLEHIYSQKLTFRKPQVQTYANSILKTAVLLQPFDWVCLVFQCSYKLYVVADL